MIRLVEALLFAWAILGLLMIFLMLKSKGSEKR